VDGNAIVDAILLWKARTQIPVDRARCAAIKATFTGETTVRDVFHLDRFEARSRTILGARLCQPLLDTQTTKILSQLQTSFHQLHPPALHNTTLSTPRSPILPWLSNQSLAYVLQLSPGGDWARS
jgi:hypothetical protein